MKTTTKTTQSAKVATALLAGQELTAKQIAALFRVKNPTAVIAKLRAEGLCIYLNKRTSSYDGQSYSKYKVGTPTKALVAAGYAFMRSV